ncbi:MAG: amidohydrolase [Acidobacteriaceae bacterium]
MKRRSYLFLCRTIACSLCVLGLPFCSAADNPPQADTIYFNGNVITMWDRHPNVQAVAIQGDRFVAVGTDADVLKTAGPGTQKIDLHGQCVIPGLIEGHVHPIMAALSEIDGPIPVFHSIPEIQTYIREQAGKLPAGQIILVPKVYSTRLAEHRYPTRQEIDAAAGGREAVVDNGYASVLDSVLLKRLGITRDTPQPANGRIVKDRNGEPTGLVLGAPQLLGKVRESRPVTPTERLWALKSMLQHYNTVGITSIDDRLEGPAGFRAYQTLHDAGELTVRSYVTYIIKAQGTPADVRKEIEQIPFVTGWGDKWLRVGSLKTIVDGGILIGTAYLRRPYGLRTQIYGFVEPGYRGVLYVPRENVFAMAQTADELGWQMTAHVTGGGSLDILLDAYEAANRVKPIAGRRFVATHANFPDERAIERARKLGVAFDVQPAWLYFDGPALKDVFGPERMKHFLPLRSLIDAGLVVGGGSDHMIRFDPRLSTNPYDPFFEMWMAITRKMTDGNVLNPEQRISRFEALKMWTWNNAYLEFSEKETGSIEPGKLADMVVISKNFAACPEDEIKDIEALQTIVGGRAIYRRESANN